MSLLAIIALFYVTLMIWAGIGDLRTMRIPNHINMQLLIGYLFAVPFVGVSLSDVVLAIAAAGTVFILGFCLFLYRLMGGGDVKLLTVTALWLGANNVGSFIFYTSVFGAMLTIGILIFRATQLPVALRQKEWILRLHQRDAGVPYGVAIATAGVLVYLRTPWVVAQF